jgi:hypothetical protein
MSAAFAQRQRKPKKENLCRGGRSQGLPGA